MTTLAFAPGGQRAPASGAGARALLQHAQGAFQKWPEGFDGFAARLRFRTARGRGEGWLDVSRRAVEIAVDDHAVEDALRAIVAEMVERRTPRFFKDADGRFPIVFDPAEEAGGLVGIRVQAPPTGALYRIDAAGRVREEERVEEGLRLVVRFETLARACPGRVLPARTRRSATDVASGRPLGVEIIEERHVRLGEAWLPGGWRIERTLDRPEILDVDFDDHRLH